jgi:hypothetical protein
MNLREQYGAFSTAGSGKAVFVLDASESAAARSEEILGLVKDVLAVLPAGLERQVYFLGNPEAYPPGELASAGGRWMNENRRRASLITPVLERQAPEDQATVVVVGSGRIFDLEDWAGTPVLERTILVSLGESMQAGQELAAEMTSPSKAELFRRLHDPIARVEICGPGFMPTDWDNPGYRFNGSSLVSEKADAPAVGLRYFVGGGAEAQVTLTHAGGRSRTVTLAPAPMPEPSGPPPGRLTPAEEAIFRAAAAQQPFECPCCRKRHSWDTLRCLQGASILGELVYPSLERANASGFVLFRTAAAGVTFALHRCDVLRLEFGKVAVRSGGRAETRTYDPLAGAWKPAAESWKPYWRTGESEYAVFL